MSAPGIDTRARNLRLLHAKVIHPATARWRSIAAGCAVVSLVTWSACRPPVPRDEVRARRLFAKACKQGNRLACVGYGVLLYNGYGGPERREEAVRLWRRACSQGQALACGELFGVPHATRRVAMPPEERLSAAKLACQALFVVGCRVFAKESRHGDSRTQDLGVRATKLDDELVVLHSMHPASFVLEVWGKRPPPKEAFSSEEKLGEALLEALRQGCVGEREGFGTVSCLVAALWALNGTVGPKDPTFARKLAEQACEKHPGFRPLCMLAADLRARGIGGPAERDQAAAAFQQASDEDLRNWCWHTAVQELDGVGDLVEGVWYPALVQFRREDLVRKCLSMGSPSRPEEASPWERAALKVACRIGGADACRRAADVLGEDRRRKFLEQLCDAGRGIRGACEALKGLGRRGRRRRRK